MRTIYLRLVGGLGNQLYQYSYALYLKENFNYDQIIIDTSGMKNYKENWGFLLYDILDGNKLSSFTSFDRSIIHKLRLSKLMNVFPWLCSLLGFVNDSNTNLINQASKRDALYLDGYFEKVDCRTVYGNILNKYLRNDLIVDIPDDALIINVRGGEYAKLGLSHKDDIELYLSLINEAKMRSLITRYYLVTDDENFAKSMFDGVLEFEYIFPQSAFENFRVLYSAKNKILSRSTFSKWAGELSSNFSNSYKMSEF